MSDIDIVKTLTSRTLELTSKRIVGKESVVEVMLITLFSEGHLLIEGVPGVAKTTMAKLFAELTGCSFGRLQFTPDLQPSDITGLYIYNQKEQRFEFHKSPLFSNIILADEINRASPKTQSALLEAMEERYVTSDGNVHKLPTPFMVLATQNPIEVEGTYPLPEAQIDRFAFKVVLDYPSSDEEMDILKLKHSIEVGDETLSAVYEFPDVEPVSTPEEILRCIRLVRKVHVEDEIMAYIRDIVIATRMHESIEHGASPRASITLLKGAKAIAAMDGRDYVIPDDVKTLIPYTLSHRLILKMDAELSGISAADVIGEVLEYTGIP